MDYDRLKQIGLDNVERNLADASAEDGIANLMETMYVLAFDAIHDAYPNIDVARAIAEDIINGV